jgi:hypothetical protein
MFMKYPLQWFSDRRQLDADVHGGLRVAGKCLPQRRREDREEGIQHDEGSRGHGLELAKDWVNSHTAIQASTDRQFKVR